MAVQCRPFHKSRELTTIISAAIYIPPDADVSIVLSQLYASINKQKQARPDGALTVSGDFNQEPWLLP